MREGRPRRLRPGRQLQDQQTNEPIERRRELLHVVPHDIKNVAGLLRIDASGTQHRGEHHEYDKRRFETARARNGRSIPVFRLLRLLRAVFDDVAGYAEEFGDKFVGDICRYFRADGVGYILVVGRHNNDNDDRYQPRRLDVLVEYNVERRLASKSGDGRRDRRRILLASRAQLLR